MKKILLFILLAILVSNFSRAQYKINKYKYDPRTYTPQMGDPYNPTVAGLASFLIPGLGQMVSHEGGRGVAFLVGTVGLYVIAIANAPTGVDYYGNVIGGNPQVAIIASIGTIVVGIASIVDAVKVAKVNNLALRDQQNTSLQLEVKPFVKSSIDGYNFQPNGGLTFSLRF